MTTPQIDRHPHSQAFHDKVSALWPMYLDEEDYYGDPEQVNFESLFRNWGQGEPGSVTWLCKTGVSTGHDEVFSVSLQDTALQALSILSRLPNHTIGVMELLDTMKTTHDRKQRDYGTSAEPFANVLASRDLGIHPVLGICLRMNDKVTRLKTFVEKGVLENESVDDSLLDTAVYAIIAVVIIEEELGE